MMPTIAIIVEGGMVRNTISDTPITAVVIDHDTEGTPDNELSHVDGVDTGVILSSKPHELDPHFVKQFREEVEKQERPFNLFSLTREWHDLSEEFWDDLSFRQQFELLAEMVAANAAEQATAMQNMAGALQSCVDQIQQMKGMFDDADGAIAAALQDAEDALDSHRALGLKSVEPDAAASRPSGMKG